MPRTFGYRKRTVGLWNLRMLLRKGNDDPHNVRFLQFELDSLDLNEIIRWLCTNSGGHFSSRCHTNNNMILCSGKSQTRHWAVSDGYRKTSVSSVFTWQDSHCKILVQVKGHHNFTVLCTNGGFRYSLEGHFYEQFHAVQNRFLKGYIVIVMANLNAKVSSDNILLGNVLAKHGLTDRNFEGFMDFWNFHHVVIDSHSSRTKLANYWGAFQPTPYEQSNWLLCD